MPLSIEIDAPIDEVFNVLNDPTKNSVWNPVTEEVNPLPQKPNECSVISFMGNFTTRKVTVQNKKVTITIEGSSVLRELDYDLTPISATKTKVKGTVIFVRALYEKMHEKVGNTLLDNLKNYVEHRYGGGKDKDFHKE